LTRADQEGLIEGACQTADTYKKEGDNGMKRWKRPVIVEIQVGMEINLYVCAEL
jgi:coenzyme PQQ precursor peptide PqqA